MKKPQATIDPDYFPILCFEHTLGLKYVVNVLPSTMIFRNLYSIHVYIYNMKLFREESCDESHLCLRGISANHVATESSRSNHGKIQCCA